MRNYPYRWFTNIATLLERRPYSVYSIALFSLFVGSVRLFAEWALGGFYPKQMFASLLTVGGFYWLSFFVMTAILRLVVPQPWRVSINVILVGVFLGIFPPLIDALIGGTGFEYSYLWHLVSDWRWEIYNPDAHLPFGEAVVLWAVILLTTLYVHFKTRSWWRTLAGFVLAYLAVMFIAGGPASLSEFIRGLKGWPFDHRSVLQVLMQFTTVLVIYLALQPALAKALARHSLAGLPYVLACILGASFGRVVADTALLYTAMLMVVLIGAFMQRAGSPADADDRRFFTITSSLIVAALAVAQTTAVFPLAVIFGANQLRSGRRLSPTAASLVRGVYGLAAFTLGIIAALEYRAFEAPRWWISLVPRPLNPRPLAEFGFVTLAAMVLVFTGYALFSALYEDWRSPEPQRRERTRWVRSATAFAALVPLLLALTGQIGWVFPAAGLVAASVVWMLFSRREKSESKWLRPVALAAPTIYLLYLIFALHSRSFGI